MQGVKQEALSRECTRRGSGSAAEGVQEVQQEVCREWSRRWAGSIERGVQEVQHEVCMK